MYKLSRSTVSTEKNTDFIFAGLFAFRFFGCTAVELWTEIQGAYIHQREYQAVFNIAERSGVRFKIPKKTIRRLVGLSFFSSCTRCHIRNLPRATPRPNAFEGAPCNWYKYCGLGTD